MRFPEFTGEWEREILNDVCTFHNGRAYKQNELLPDGKYRVLRVGNFFTNDSWYYSDLELDDEKIAVNGDLLYAWSASFGPRFWTGEKVIYHYHIWKIDSFQQVSKEFLFYFLERDTEKIKNEVQGGTMVHIAKGDMEKREILYPSILEQSKIARLLSLLDERIATQNKIIEDLKKLKSAIVEALFCAPRESMPAKRLSPYSKEWKLIKLSDICQRVQTKNTGSKCRQVLTITAQYGLVNQEDFFNMTVASENLEGYYLLRKGDFAYNKSYSGDYAWGAVKRLDRYEQGVLSPLYICFRPDTAKVDADYLVHYFESKKWHKGIADIAGEGARNHGLLNISVIDFFNTIHRIPDLDEQKDIAQVLNLLSFKLSCGQHVMQSLTMQRSYLLQKMFI